MGLHLPVYICDVSEVKDVKKLSKRTRTMVFRTRAMPWRRGRYLGSAYATSVPGVLPPPVAITTNWRASDVA